MRTIFIGDIHGCLLELQDLINKLSLVPEDRVILLWDLINKWPYSAETVQYVYENEFECVRGNHDEAYKQFFKHSHLRHYFGPLKYETYKETMTPEAHQWYVRTPLYIESDEWIAVHAGLEPGNDPADTAKKILLNIRTWDELGIDLDDLDNPAWHELYSGEKTVIYGHWAQQGLHRNKKTIGIDSGCVYGGFLSAYIYEADEIVSVPAREAYMKIKK